MKFIIKNGVLKKIKGARNLKEIEIPEGVTSIDKKAFKGCSSLKKVIIPGSIKVVDSTLINSINFASSVEEYEIKEGVEVIGESAFSKTMTFVKNVTLPNGLLKIENHAFDSCRKLETIKIPASVKIIGEGAFAHCDSLRKVEINEGTEIIEKEAFFNCAKLEKIDIPTRIKSMGDHAFCSCKSLKKVYIKNNLESIGDGCFMNCENLEELSLPQKIDKCGKGIIVGCNKFKRIKMPKNGWFLYRAVGMEFDSVHLLKDGMCLSLKGIEIEKDPEKEEVIDSCDLMDLYKAFPCIEYCSQFMVDEDAKKLFEHVKMFNRLGVRMGENDFANYKNFEEFQKKDLSKFETLCNYIKPLISDEIYMEEFIKIADNLGLFEKDDVTINLEGKKVPVSNFTYKLLEKAFTPFQDEKKGEIKMSYAYLTNKLHHRAKKIKGYDEQFLKDVLQSGEIEHARKVEIAKGKKR